MNVCWLGRVAYEDALQRQETLLEQRLKGEIEDTLLLLEHEPVYTIGRGRDRSSLDAGVVLPHPVVEISRGGKATYHGPGQLVGYAILDLRQYGQDLHAYLRALELSLIALCADLGLQAERREELTGTWIGDRKLASIGVGVRRWITMHGFALNVCDDLAGFDAIIPCGIAGVTMTSLAQELPDQEFSVEKVAQKYPPFLQKQLNELGAKADLSKDESRA
jgi:lipoyl(octanoyl) transferase